MSFHAGQTFTFGEQPSATKWQYLWDNDYALADGTGISDDALLSRHYAAKSVNAEALDAGVPVQIVQTDFATLAAQTATIPYDNTIPQIGEGFEVMTQAITPKFSTSSLIVEADIYGSAAAGPGELSGALFRDATGNALAADSATVVSSGYLVNIRVRAKVAASSTSATTFRVRIGASSNVVTSFNGYPSTQAFGAAAKSNIKVTEVRA